MRSASPPPLSLPRPTPRGVDASTNRQYAPQCPWSLSTPSSYSTSWCLDNVPAREMGSRGKQSVYSIASANNDSFPRRRVGRPAAKHRDAFEHRHTCTVHHNAAHAAPQNEARETDQAEQEVPRLPCQPRASSSRCRPFHAAAAAMRQMTATEYLVVLFLQRLLTNTRTPCAPSSIRHVRVVWTVMPRTRPPSNQRPDPNM